MTSSRARSPSLKRPPVARATRQLYLCVAVLMLNPVTVGIAAGMANVMEARSSARPPVHPSTTDQTIDRSIDRSFVVERRTSAGRAWWRAHNHPPPGPKREEPRTNKPTLKTPPSLRAPAWSPVSLQSI